MKFISHGDDGCGICKSRFMIKFFDVIKIRVMLTSAPGAPVKSQI
jgi:hypothetical protein